MKWYHKVGIGIGTFIVGFIPTAFVVQNRINASIQPYVESHLEKVIENQEERLGIQHFGIPKISFEQPPWVENGLQAMRTAGGYEPKTDEVYLPLGLAITPDKNLVNTLATYMTLGSTHNVKETLDHELGHFYANNLNKSLGRGHWPNFSDKQKSDDKIGTEIISEGIATYFERTMNDKQDDFKDSDWPEKLEDFLTVDVIYSGGFHLVKSVINMYGKRGIEYLIVNPPSIGDLDNLPAYQNRVLQSLSSQPQK